MLALVVAVWSVSSISLVPPGLHSRDLKMATATTHVVVDTPKSSVLDLRQNTYDFQALTQRAILLGNVMANGPVRAAIATQAHVPVDALQVAPPLTPKQPRATVGTGPQPSVSDIAKSTQQYKLSIEANPTVPVLDIYAQAPDATTAAALANGSSWPCANTSGSWPRPSRPRPTTRSAYCSSAQPPARSSTTESTSRSRSSCSC